MYIETSNISGKSINYENYVLCNLSKIVMINYFKHNEVFIKIFLLLFDKLKFDFVLELIKEDEIINLMMFVFTR